MSQKQKSILNARSLSPSLAKGLNQLRTAISPKRISRPSADRIGSRAGSSRKLWSGVRQYIVNKTTFVTPGDKSTRLSYTCTPLEKSTNQLNKTLNPNKTLTMCKDQLRSTEQETYSENCLEFKVNLNDKVIFARRYDANDLFTKIKRDFIHQFSQRGKAQNYIGLFGFDVKPFNYILTQIINGAGCVRLLIDRGVKQITVTPLLANKQIPYDSLSFKDFDIIGYLGSGGFSHVYLARCRLDGQYSALKFIAKSSITSSKKARMLQNQKDILFSIKHRSLIDLHYAFQTSSYIVFGLEYCPNGSLYNYMQQVKTVTQDRAKSMIRQILVGLEYLHTNNILFRDIKLENLLFDSEGRVKITDFGLSKPDVQQDEITYSYCGSPEYMAPEMLTKQNEVRRLWKSLEKHYLLNTVFYNPQKYHQSPQLTSTPLRSGHSYAVDYYALGILLYELLFGRSPFYAPKKEDIFQAILNFDPVFPKSPAVSKEVKSLIKGLLTKNPKHRIGSLKGAKQILGHPWMRLSDSNGTTDDNNTNGNSNSNTNIKPSHFIPTQPLKEVPPKMQRQFDKEKLKEKFDTCFFERFFVNRALVQKTQKDLMLFPKQVTQSTAGVRAVTQQATRPQIVRSKGNFLNNSSSVNLNQYASNPKKSMQTSPTSTPYNSCKPGQLNHSISSNRQLTHFLHNQPPFSEFKEKELQIGKLQKWEKVEKLTTEAECQRYQKADKQDKANFNDKVARNRTANGGQKKLRQG